MRIGLSVLATLLLTGSTAGQQQPPRTPARGGGRVVVPQQQAQPPHVVPNVPQLQRRQPPPTAPFQLSPREQAEVDQVLAQWEQQSAQFRKFECTFTRFEYDKVFGQRDVARFVDLGYLKYAAPDKGVFRVTHTKKNNQVTPIEQSRAEHWICDGQSIFGYDFVQQQLVEHKLPPELRGKAISNGPLPFLFGAQAQRLKQRYWIRIVTPRDRNGQVLQHAQGEVWLEAYPRYQADAANFGRAELILKRNGMAPFALQLYLPGGDQRTVYQFANIKINARDPADLLDLFPDNDFRAQVPMGWQKIVEDAPPTREAGRPAGKPTR
jgi:TIGR03009 family protein